MNTPKEAVGDLAIALGMLMAAEGCPKERQPAYECFVESVLVLAHAAGLPRREALPPFDVHQQFAVDTYEMLEAASRANRTDL